VTATPAPDRNPLVRIYDQVSGLVERRALRFDEVLARHPHPERLGAAYGASVIKPFRLMTLLSANVRVYAIFLACMARDPSLFWWFELLPMTAILVIGLYWLRSVESQLIHNIGLPTVSFSGSPPHHSKDAIN
jgi:hypothetical protein